MKLINYNNTVVSGLTLLSGKYALVVDSYNQGMAKTSLPISADPWPEPHPLARSLLN